MTPLTLQHYLSKDRPTRLNRTVRDAKEAFLADQHEVALQLARPVIMRSWEDARSRGLDPSVERAPTALGVDEIERLLETRTLGRVGRTVLNQFDDLVATTRHVIVLADELGQILYSVGHEPLRGELDRVNFRPGGVWSVDEVGPNGIGTVLKLGQPEMVFGHEHFCEGWSPWVCYGAPVYHPETNRLVGVVDITGPASSARLESMGLTISIASAIEQQMTLDAMRRRELLRDRSRASEQRWPNEALLHVTGQGVMVDANPAGIELFNIADQLYSHPLLADALPEVWEPLATAIRLGEASLVDVRRGHDELRVRVEPVYFGREVVGSTLVCSRRGGCASAEGAVGSRSEGGIILPKERPPQTSFGTALAAADGDPFASILGTSATLAQALRHARTAAAVAPDDAVLVEGETGTGKELVAQAIHRASPRGAGPLIVVNCGAMPRDLAEAELFGYAGGAFTGARRQGQAGCFEQADGGTLFLDEVDSLPLDLQVKFLRVVETGEVMRIGEHRARAVDVRVLAATGQALEPLVQAGQFRQDLFHRLNVLRVPLPPLREREGDVAFLAEHFMRGAAERYARRAPTLAPGALALLEDYGWPGNVRELRNICRRVVLNAESDIVQAHELPEELRQPLPNSAAVGDPGPRCAEAVDLKRLTDQTIEDAIARNGGNIQAAARELGISRATIYRRRAARD